MPRVTGMQQPDRGLVDPIFDPSIARALPDAFPLAAGGFAVTGVMVEGWDGAFVRVLRLTPAGTIIVNTVPLVTNLANTTAPLAAAGVFTSVPVQINDSTVGSMGASISDTIAMLSGGGTLEMQVSKDGLTWFSQITNVLAPGIPVFVNELRLTGIFARCVLTSAAASAAVVLHADLRSS